MKHVLRLILAASCLSLGGCLFAAGNRSGVEARYSLAAGGAGGPAAVFKLDQQTGQLWYAWWDPSESRYRWRLIEPEEKPAAPAVPTEPSK